MGRRRKMADMTMTLCECCKRAVQEPVEKGRCWECNDRPYVAGRVKRLPGERDPSCPHAVPRGA
jgi:hypothetical protein